MGRENAILYKERIFPNNSKVTITVRFSLLVDLSCDVSVTHVNAVESKCCLTQRIGGLEAKNHQSLVSDI